MRQVRLNDKNLGRKCVLKVKNFRCVVKLKTLKTLKNCQEIERGAEAWCETLTSHIVVIDGADGYAEP